MTIPGKHRLRVPRRVHAVTRQILTRQRPPTTAASSPDGGVSVAVVDGELDLVGGRCLRSALLKLSGRQVVVDLTSVTFVDLAGLDALVAAAGDLAARRRKVEIVPSSALERLLGLIETTGHWVSLPVVHAWPAEVTAIALIRLPGEPEFRGADPGALRPVERRVLRLLSDGLTTEEIAFRFQRGVRWVLQVAALAEHRLRRGAARSSPEPSNRLPAQDMRTTGKPLAAVTGSTLPRGSSNGHRPGPPIPATMTKKEQVMSEQPEAIPRAAWRDFLESLSKEHEGTEISIEVLDPEWGDQQEAHARPLAYAEYDQKHDVVIIAVHGTDPRDVVLRHLIAQPRELFADPAAPSLVRALDVVRSDGTHTLVTFHPYPALESETPA